MSVVCRCSRCFTSICLPPRRRSFHDKTLKWARENPHVAQECLNPPPLPASRDELLLALPRNGKSVSVALLGPNPTWQHFFEWRQWIFPVDKESDLDKAHALTSHVLSAPLTMATNLTSRSTSSTTKSKQLRWCCIGARAEASLPLEYWKEMLLLLSAMSTRDDPVHLTLDFVGPDIVKRPSVQLSCKDAQLDLQWLYAGKFHDWWVSTTVNSTATLSDYDAFILLNPGLGHAHLKEDWKPTLDLLLSFNDHPHENSKVQPPIILATAHSWLDANRDTAVWRDDYGLESTTYTENPWASRITYEDPLEDAQAQHIVRPNHYVATLQ